MAEPKNRLQRQANLPPPPREAEQVLAYVWHLDKAISDLYSNLAELLQFSIPIRDEVAFAAADTTKAVVFESVLDDASYNVHVTPDWNATLRVTSRATTGFTITASAAPGGSGGTVTWTVVR